MEFSKQVKQKTYMLYFDDNKNFSALIGFFSNKEKAKEIIEKRKLQKGIKDFPEGFKIKTMIIGKNYYTKGFKSKCLK
ncbi:hypothetical protein [Leptotrichia wadei]|uniref:SPOR domain-containing protein n=1 Tax=Leptotrichia wadei (strain F0279) TaxID=888055 RepID=U2RH07_LEPWF|nr:hypothetical protein [Leptotrichia wadei]ERK52843.1 hypothetical protein HMPREF9015_00711 [Leptotrichia wadei F0279]